MNITTNVIRAQEPCAVALGLFDGVHLAHQQVIREMAALSESRGLVPTVLTFSMDHARPEKKRGQQLLLREELKLEEFQKLGVRQVICPEFEDIRDYAPAEFVRDFLRDRMKAQAVICGYDFRFGKNAVGGVDILAAEGQKLGIQVKVVPPFYKDGAPVSSTRIRECLLAGDAEEAHALLGRPFFIREKVAQGNRLGNRMGYPTINQAFRPGYLVPKHGVYATVVRIGEKRYKGITNAGVKPTVAGEEQLPLAETFILGYSGTLYHQEVELSFIRFLREERRFSNLDELYSEIRRNVQQVEEMQDLIS